MTRGSCARPETCSFEGQGSGSGGVRFLFFSFFFFLFSLLYKYRYIAPEASCVYKRPNVLQVVVTIFKVCVDSSLPFRVRPWPVFVADVEYSSIPPDFHLHVSLHECNKFIVKGNRRSAGTRDHDESCRSLGEDRNTSRLFPIRMWSHLTFSGHLNPTFPTGGDEGIDTHPCTLKGGVRMKSLSGHFLHLTMHI